MHELGSPLDQEKCSDDIGEIQLLWIYLDLSIFYAVNY